MSVWALKEISKRFGGTQALENVSLEITTGSCHALMGENGAGKSTLARIIAGIIPCDSGELFLDGEPVRFSDQSGIAIVQQEVLCCPNLTVAENVCLHDLPRRGIFVDADAMRQRALEVLLPFDPSIDVDMPMGLLSVGRRQLVQIASAVSRNVRLILFDEATSSLSEVEAQRLFELVRKLRASGTTCVWVSHRMHELFSLCDAVSVLRDGKHIVTGPIRDFDREGIVKAMVGRDIGEVEPPQPTTADFALEVEHLTSPGRFREVSFTVKKGEILGIAGLVGSGRSEILQALFGLDPLATGTVRVLGKPLQPLTIDRAIVAGLGLIPESRKDQALASNLNVRENLALASLPVSAKSGLISAREESARTDTWIEDLGIKTSHRDAPIDSLSGGNQQKVVLGRWLAANSQVLLMDEPTRGVDIGAKTEIHKRLSSLAAEGLAIVMVSSELPELLAHCHRIAVIHNGEWVGELTREEATEERLMTLMTSETQPA